MIHTYRDSTILDHKALQFVLFPLVVFRRIRGALFPVGCVAGLVWLTIETLTAK
jgi:hypothetical protein